MHLLVTLPWYDRGRFVLLTGLGLEVLVHSFKTTLTAIARLLHSTKWSVWSTRIEVRGVSRCANEAWRTLLHDLREVPVVHSNCAGLGIFVSIQYHS